LANYFFEEKAEAQTKLLNIVEVERFILSQEGSQLGEELGFNEEARPIFMMNDEKG
jgi:hypothetical protein